MSTRFQRLAVFVALAHLSSSAFALDSVGITVGGSNSSDTNPAGPGLGQKVDPDQLGFDGICGPLLRGDKDKIAKKCADQRAKNPLAELTPECKRSLNDWVLADENASNQLLANCRAGEVARKGKNANRSLTSIWQGIAITCFATCSMPFGQQFCPIAVIGGAANELLQTKEIQQLAMSFLGAQALGGMVGSRLATGSMVHTTSNPVDKTKNFTQDPNKLKQQQKQKSCYQNATFALLQSLLKQQGQGSMNSNYDNAWKNIKLLYDSTGPSGVNGSMAVAANTAALGFARNDPGFRSTSSAVTESGDGAAISDPCAQADSGDTGAVIRCAKAWDNRLPPIVDQPQFADLFKEKTGTSLGEFMKNKGGLDSAELGRAFGGGDSGRAASIESGLKSALPKLASIEGATQNLPDAGTGAYAQGRGGSARGGSADSGGMPDFAKLMEAAMGGGGAGRAPASTGVSELDFLMKHKSPEQIAEDRKISIFDRISYRYRETTPKMGF